MKRPSNVIISLCQQMHQPKHHSHWPQISCFYSMLLWIPWAMRDCHIRKWVYRGPNLSSQQFNSPNLAQTFICLIIKTPNIEFFIWCFPSSTWCNELSFCEVVNQSKQNAHFRMHISNFAFSTVMNEPHEWTPWNGRENYMKVSKFQHGAHMSVPHPL